MILQHFNPHDINDDDLVQRIATGREDTLQRILQIAQENLEAVGNVAPLQHLLIVAPRGYGKSFLARLTVARLNKLQEERQKQGKDALPIAVALLPEEQPNVNAPHLLIEEIQRIFEDQPVEIVLPTWISEDGLHWDQAVANLDAALDDRFGKGQGLLIAMVENFDEMVKRVFKENEAESRLRQLMSQHPRLMFWLATTGATIDQRYENRLFHACRHIDLAPWTEEECLEYFNRHFEEFGHDKLSKYDEAKARALALFINGTPRLATLLADILIDKDAGRAADILDALLDELTPYYKTRLEQLNARQQTLLDTLLRKGEPCSQSELAGRLGIKQSDIAQPFNDLKRERLIHGQRASDGRETLYRVADRVLAHYYRKRFLRHGQKSSPLEAIAEFLEKFFTAEEKREEAEKLRKNGRETDAIVLERLIPAEPDERGPLRGYVFGAAYRLRYYAKAILAPDALPPMESILSAFAEHRYQEVLGAFDNSPQVSLPEPERLIGLLLLGSALMQTEENQEKTAAWQRLDTAVTLAEQSSRAEWLFAAHDMRGWWRGALGQKTAERIDMQRSAELQGQLSGELRRLAKLNVARIASHQGDHEACAKSTGDLAHWAKDSGDEFVASRAFELLAWNLGKLNRYKEAVTAATQAAQLAERIGDEGEYAAAKLLQAWSLGESEQFEAAIQAATEAQSAINTTQNLHNQILLKQIRAWGLGKLGRHAEAEQVAHQTMALAEHHGDTLNQARLARWIAVNLSNHQFGRDQEALDYAEKALAAAENIEQPDERLREVLLCWYEIFRTARFCEKYPRALEAYLQILHISANGGEKEDLPKAMLEFQLAVDCALRASQWEKLQQAVIDHSEQFQPFPAWSSHTVAEMIANLAEQQGRAVAFKIISEFLKAIVPATVLETNVFATEWDELLSDTLGELVRRLKNPALLRDIADRVGEQIPEKTVTLCKLLKAAACYAESDGNERSLERTDPDIAMAIQRTHNLPAVDSGRDKPDFIP